jgi:hypothetical protein
LAILIVFTLKMNKSINTTYKKLAYI